MNSFSTQAMLADLGDYFLGGSLQDASSSAELVPNFLKAYQKTFFYSAFGKVR